MASAIDTANPDQPLRRTRGGPAPDSPAAQGRAHRKRAWSLGSRLGRTIVLLNLLGLGILVGGALILNEMRQGLVNASSESLAVQGQLIANAIDQSATVGEPEPMLAPGVARGVLQSLDIPNTERARLYDPQGRLLADSYQVADRVERRPLPAARRPGQMAFSFRGSLFPRPASRAKEARLALAREVAAALSGDSVRDVRIGEEGGRVVSVSVPIKRVRAVLGVLTLEAGDVDSIILHEREALIPFILIAIGVALLSSLVLTQFIAVPVLRLARAADRVRLSRARAIALPDLAERDDEIGDLTRSLEAMTATLADRMLAIERFAADVSHELRNPMTSIRSAVETLDLVKTNAQRERLIAILNHDVGRLDRLITDISNASRLDAELSRNAPAPMEVARLLSDICDFYAATSKPGEPRVTFIGPPTSEPMMVVGREGPLGQVFRNLVDNARSFSPPGGEVRVFVTRGRGEILARVEDDGPGVPPDNLETIFERFYTSRPKGAAFGGNSGLGLAIARQIIETHGGRIWAENRHNGDRVIGASFRVALPTA
ncbi:MAG TPA: stimulus-sensing domain-containing protein [Caulobacteraceae bacterium]|nr:stimulus-sensing domain-containing protein [Caulobacteraceae bacterium]